RVDHDVAGQRAGGDYRWPRVRVPLGVSARDYGRGRLHVLEEAVGDIVASVVASFGHVAREHPLPPRIRIQQCLLTLPVEVPGQEDPRPTEAQPEQDAVTVGVLRVRTQVAHGRLAANTSHDRSEHLDRRGALAGTESRQVDL